MNEMLNDIIGLQRYSNDLARAEQAYAQHTALNTDKSPARTRVALGLVALATKLQPTLMIDARRQPAFSVEGPQTRHLSLPVGELCIGQESR